MNKRPESQLDDLARKFATTDVRAEPRYPKRKHRRSSNWMLTTLLILALVLAVVAAGFMIATNGGI